MNRVHFPSLNKCLVEALLYGLFISFFLFFFYYLLEKYFFTPSEVVNLQSAMRVDLAELPKWKDEELKKLEKVIKDKEEKQLDQKPIDKTLVEKNEIKSTAKEVTNKIVEPKKNTDDQSELEDLFKKIKKSNAKVAKTATHQKPKENELKHDPKVTKGEIETIVRAGNKLSKGGSEQQGDQKQDISDFETYILEATVKVREFWQLPSYLAKDNWRCRIQVFINESGSIALLKVIESSGSEQFDTFAREAIINAKPFRPPEGTALARLKRGHFVLGFPL